MKRMISLGAVVVAIALLTFSVSAEDSNVYKIYNKAMQEMDAATSIEMSGTTKIALGTVMTIPGTFHSQIVTGADGKVQFAVTETTTIMDADTVTAKYYKGGYLYEYTDGKQTGKTKMAQDKALYYSKLPFTYEKALMKDAVLTNVDAGQQIQVKAKGDGFNQTSTYLVGADGSLKGYKQTYTTLSKNDSVKVTTTLTIDSLNKLESIAFPAGI